MTAWQKSQIADAWKFFDKPTFFIAYGRDGDSFYPLTKPEIANQKNTKGGAPLYDDLV